MHDSAFVRIMVTQSMTEEAILPSASPQANRSRRVNLLTELRY